MFYTKKLKIIRYHLKIITPFIDENSLKYPIIDIIGKLIAKLYTLKRQQSRIDNSEKISPYD